MSEERKHGRVEDFTVPFLISAGALLFFGLSTLWALYGFLPTLILAWFCERTLTFSAARPRAR